MKTKKNIKDVIVLPAFLGVFVIFAILLFLFLSNENIINYLNIYSFDIVLVLSFLLSISCFIIALILALQRFIMKSDSFLTVGIIICLILSLAFIILTVVIIRIKTYYDISLDNNNNATLITIADLQANTLAITTLIVTFSSVILAILSIYREKKADENIKKFEETSSKVENTDNFLKALANIASVQLIAPDNYEFYYDVIEQFIDYTTKEENEYNEHFIVTKIGLINQSIKRDPQMAYNPDKYNQIIDLADNVINSNTSTLNKQFAYLESLNSLYLKIQNSIRINPFTAKTDIDKAFELLKNFNTITEDRSGNISNLYGLIYLWSGIAERRMFEYDIRDNHFSERRNLPIKYLYQARDYFDKALKVDERNMKYMNHQVVALTQINDLEYSDDLDKELNKLLKQLMDLYPNSDRVQINYASKLIRDIYRKLGLKSLNELPDRWKEFEKLKEQNISISELTEYYNIIKSSREQIEKCQKLNSSFINGYYKMVEAITLQIILSSLLSKKEELFALVYEARNNIEMARNIALNNASRLYCEYGFYTLIGEKDNAEKTLHNIKSINNNNL